MATSRCKSARTLSVFALAAILSIPTYCVASEVTDKLNLVAPLVDTAPRTSPTFTAVFVVPSATVQFPSLTSNFVIEPSGIVISAVFAP